MAAVIMTGCATSRPYTKGERIAFAGAVAGQAWDMGSTAYAICGTDDFNETNPIFSDMDDGQMMASLFLTKAALIGGGYLLGEWKPNWRIGIYSIIGGTGAACGAANTYTMNAYGD